MAVVASPPQVLCFLGGSIVGMLDRNSVGNGVSSHERELGVLLGVVGVGLRRHDDGRVIFEFDPRAFSMLEVTV